MAGSTFLGKGGGSSVSRNASTAWTSRLLGGGPYIVSLNDFAMAAPRPFCQPCQVHGPVLATFRKLGVNFGVPKESSFSVSKFMPLVCPSVWQVWQLNHWLCERFAS